MMTIVFCLRRKPGMSAAEFHRYWRDEHGPLVRDRAEALRIRRYVQKPRLTGPGMEAAAAARGAPEPYDGVAEISWDGPDDLAAAFETPEGRRAGRELLEDERRFIDLAASPIFVTEENVVVGQATAAAPP